MDNRYVEHNKAAIGKLTDDVMMSCSRLPSLFGKNKYSSPNEELQKSFNALQPDYERPVIENDPIHFGNVSEPYNLEHAGKKLNMKVETGIEHPYLHDTLPLAGSVDGIGLAKNQTIKTDEEKGVYCFNENGKIIDSLDIDGPGILEAKLVGSYPTEVPDPSKGPIQVQGLMMCSGLTWSAVSILYQGMYHKVYVYKANPVLQKRIEEEVIEFDQRIKTYKRDGVTDWYPIFRPNEGPDVYTLDDGLPTLNLTEELAGVAELILDAKENIKNTQIYLEKSQAELMSFMGNHQFAEGHGIKLEWGKTSPRKEYTVPANPGGRSKSLKISLVEEDKNE